MLDIEGVEEEMKVEFLTGTEIGEMHHSGETVLAYQYPYKDMPKYYSRT
jgi:hypothetical protein